MTGHATFLNFGFLIGNFWPVTFEKTHIIAPRVFSFVPTVQRRPKASAANGLYPDRNQLLRGFPKLSVDEIGGEAAQERELFGLPWPDLEGTRLQRSKRLLHQLVGSHHSDAALDKLCRHVGLHGGWHQLDDFHASFLQLEPQRLGVGVNRGFGGAVYRSRRQRHEREHRGCIDHGTLVGPEDIDKRRNRANYATYVDIHLRH